MTIDEKKQQRANLIVELEDEQNEFAHDREAAISRARAFMSWLLD